MKSKKASRIQGSSKENCRKAGCWDGASWRNPCGWCSQSQQEGSQGKSTPEESFRNEEKDGSEIMAKAKKCKKCGKAKCKC